MYALLALVCLMYGFFDLTQGKACRDVGFALATSFDASDTKQCDLPFAKRLNEIRANNTCYNDCEHERTKLVEHLNNPTYTEGCREESGVCGLDFRSQLVDGKCTCKVIVEYKRMLKEDGLYVNWPDQDHSELQRCKLEDVVGRMKIKVGNIQWTTFLVDDKISTHTYRDNVKCSTGMTVFGWDKEVQKCTNRGVCMESIFVFWWQRAHKCEHAGGWPPSQAWPYAYKGENCNCLGSQDPHCVPCSGPWRGNN